MSQWLNHVAIAAPRNATASHTVTPSSGSVVAGSAFTPTSGRLLVCEIEGAVTSTGTPGGAGSTAPVGWSGGAAEAGCSSVNNTGLYVVRKTAAGGDSLTAEHNGSNYPAVFHFYEFPAGSTWVGSVAATAVNPGGGAGPTLSGMSGTNQVYGVGAQATSASFVGPWAGSWSTGTEIVDTSVAYATTDGYTFGVTEFVDYASSTASAAWTSTNGSGLTVERLVWAVSVPAGPSVPPTVPPRSTWYMGTSPKPSPALLLAPSTRVVAAEILLGATGVTVHQATSATSATASGSSAPTLLASVSATTAAVAGGSSAPERLGTVHAATATTAATANGSSAPTARYVATSTTAASSANSAAATLLAKVTATTAAIADGSSSPTLIGGTNVYPATSATAATADGSSAPRLIATATSATTATSGSTSTARLIASVTSATAATSGSTSTASLVLAVTATTNAVSGTTSLAVAVMRVTATTTATAGGSSAPTLIVAAAYLPLVEADHIRLVPVRDLVRLVDPRPDRTVPVRDNLRTVEARDYARTVPTRPHTRSVP